MAKDFHNQVYLVFLVILCQEIQRSGAKKDTSKSYLFLPHLHLYFNSSC